MSIHEQRAFAAKNKQAAEQQQAKLNAQQQAIDELLDLSKRQAATLKQQTAMLTDLLTIARGQERRIEELLLRGR
jgi:hypothetical protein